MPVVASAWYQRRDMLCGNAGDDHCLVARKNTEIQQCINTKKNNTKNEKNIIGRKIYVRQEKYLQCTHITLQIKLLQKRLQQKATKTAKYKNTHIKT